MKNSHPIITATASNPVNPDSSSSSEEPIIRLKLDKPLHWEWELTTSADKLPVIQLLDKDGRLLVETTGRTAQRARGSFRDGLKSHEEFPIDSTSSAKDEISSTTSTSTSTSTVVPTPREGNRNIDGFSTKFGSTEFGYKPRKSRSEISVKDKREKKRKRHSTGIEQPSIRVENNNEKGVKRYSAGDYLRQQIMDDLRTRNNFGKTPEEVARDRCKKVKAYLRSQSDVLPHILRNDEPRETADQGFPPDEKNLKRMEKNGEEVETIAKTRWRKVRSYVKSENGSGLKAEEKQSEKSENLSKIEEDAVEPEARRLRREELAKIKAYLQEKIKRKMDQEERSSKSRERNGSPESGIRKRHSEYRRDAVDRKNYRTRKVRSETNIIRFEPEILERERLKSKQLEKEARSRTDRESPEESMLARKQRGYRRSKSDVLVKVSEKARPQLKRESSSLEKRKLYRKTKSDVLLGQIGASLDSEELNNPPRRIKSQDNVERSWREYKERKKHERLRRESEKEVLEEDFMSKPRWKDFQNELCAVRNCKVCQNLRNCVDPLRKVELRNSEEKALFVGEKNSSSSMERSDTSLRENYPASDRISKDPRDTSIARIQVKDHRNLDAPLTNLNSPDFGYNSIPKSSFKDYRELYAKSNVKKSDTFKIVDGSENPEDALPLGCASGGQSFEDEKSENNFAVEGSLTNKSNEDIAKDYFKRVYELLKRRQEDARKIAEGRVVPGYDDSSSSNYVEEVQRKRHRRKKKEKTGEEVVTVPPTSGGQESWKAQRIPVNESPGNRRRGCRVQLQPVSAGKRTRPAQPPPSISCKVNAKDIEEYFADWPNKENTPGNAVNRRGDEEESQFDSEKTMGSNLSRHNGKGLTGRRTQSSGNLCDPKGKLNSMGKILVPCSTTHRERYKFCGSLPNHLDDKDALDDAPKENNNIMPDTIAGNLGGTLPHKKRSLGVHFSDGGPTGTLDLVKHRSQDSLDENDPWRYQQSDLDLVRCRHGNFDSVRRNRSTDAVSTGESGRRYARGTSLEGRCHRNSDLDLVGTLPKRKAPNSQDPRKIEVETNSVEQDPTDQDELLMKMVHKPDCELVKHRQQLSKCVDLKLNKLTGGEPQDQGYASERSPEDEHPPSLPGQPFPSVTPESTFRVTLQKSSRGLGLSVSGGGTAGPVRVKRLFPQQPAALSNKLQPGDILLAANGIPLTGLTNYEALEVLRTTPSTVELVVCRLPGDTNITPPGAPPPPPARREPPSSLRILNPLPPLQIEPCGEFDIEMTKVGGSLGFTLRKADSSALGHYVRALVREPALSDGRIRPGDKIVAVDGAPLSPMSHEEAVQLLRQCGPTVRLRLYRDLAQTPVSALSPTEPDHPLRPPRTSLRQEAVDMLCDLAVRKLSPGTSSGSSCKQSPGASCNSPRRLRRLATRTPTAETDQETLEKLQEVQTASTGSQAETSDSDQCSIKTQITNSQPNTPATDIIDPPPLYDVCDSSDSLKPSRPSFLDLTAPQGKAHFQFCSLDSDVEYSTVPGGTVIVAETESIGTEDTDYEDRREVPALSSEEHDNDLPSEPASMPPVLSSTSGTSTAAFSYKNPAYQSANPACGAGIDTGAKNKATHSSDQDIPGKILGADDPGGSKGLLKWKGVMFAPNDEVAHEKEEDQTGKDVTDSAGPIEDLEQGNEVFMVELTRGWNSRLGFSLQPEGNRTVISVVHPDSVAAKDGRLKQGDVLMMVNDESVEHMSTADIIDLLRKIRGSIGITVMRRCKREPAT